MPGPETCFAHTTKIAWDMLPHAGGELGIVLNVLTSLGKNPWARPPWSKTPTPSISCPPTSTEISGTDSIESSRMMRQQHHNPNIGNNCPTSQTLTPVPIEWIIFCGWTLAIRWKSPEDQRAGGLCLLWPGGMSSFLISE